MRRYYRSIDPLTGLPRTVVDRPWEDEYKPTDEPIRFPSRGSKKPEKTDPYRGP
ncbi:MAG: hypothetical protein LBR00_06695 [Clostridiales Family XIII bacterium]|nr:hypothetical protein [Clostridiales Family XIII bacterium]